MIVVVHYFIYRDGLVGFNEDEKVASALSLLDEGIKFYSGSAVSAQSSKEGERLTTSSDDDMPPTTVVKRQRVCHRRYHCNIS